MPESVDLWVHSDGGVYRWRQLLALIAMDGVAGVLFPLDLPSSKRERIRLLSQVAERDLSKIDDMWRIEADEDSFFSDSERIIRSILVRIQREVGDECARLVYEYGTLRNTAREFAWKTLLRRLSKARRTGASGYTQRDIQLSDAHYGKLLDLVEAYLAEVSPDHIIERVGATGSALELTGGSKAFAEEESSVLYLLTDLVGWRAVIDLFRELKEALPSIEIDKFISWARLRASDLGIDPMLLSLPT